MFESLKQLLVKGKQILIIPNTINNGDIFFAALGLSKILEESGLKTHVLSSRLKDSKIWQFKLKKVSRFEIITDIPKSYSFTLPDFYQIKDVSLEKKSEGYKINLSSGANQPLPQAINLEPSPINYDLIVIIGSLNLNSLLSLGLDQKLLETTQKILLTQQKIFLNNTLIFQETGTKSKGFSIMTKKLLENIDLPITKLPASLLLAGLIYQTDSFRKNVNPDLFDATKQLIELGADYQHSYELSIRDLTITKIKYISEILKNVSEFAPGIYSSEIKLQQNQNLKLNLTEILKLGEIYNCKLALVSLTYPGFSRVYLRCNDNSLDLKGILGHFKGKGNKYQGLITLNEPFSQFLTKLKRFLKLEEGQDKITPTNQSQVVKEPEKVNAPDTLPKKQKDRQVQKLFTQTKAEQGANTQVLDPLAPAKDLPTPLQIGPTSINTTQVDFSPLPKALGDN